MQENLISDGIIINRCPVDGHSLAPVRVNSESEIKNAVVLARTAQEGWEAIGFEKRARLLKSAGKEMLKRRQELLELIHDEAGKTPAELLMSEAVGPLQTISDWIRVARPWLKPRKLPISPLAFPRKRGVIEMLPRGVIGIIAPWNYPLANFFKPVFAALLCGNAVVIKPSEFSPRTAIWFAKIMGNYLPPHVLGLVQGDRQVGQALVQSGVDAITFTGSYSSGKEVARTAAAQMIPCSVELGGKDAAIVIEDCVLDRTVAGIMHWALHNAGQACGDIERVYVENSIADRFVEMLVAAVSALRVHSGDPQTSDLGPSVHLGQLKIIEDHVADARAKGAKILCGGSPAATATGKGLWFEPTVLDHCDHSMRVMKEPTFGPVIPIVRVKDAEQGVILANDCEYGLNASIWSSNEKRAVSLGRRLQVGTVFINNHAFTGAIPAAPWTGVKKTGYGIANSIFGLQHYTRPRTLVVDRKKSADGWWLPMDTVAEELGHRLAQAQLGNLLAALKIPFLMSQRQKTVIAFVREGKRSQEPLKSSPQNGLKFWSKGKQRIESGAVNFKFLCIKLIKKTLPRLTQREIAWGQAAMGAIFSGAPPENLKPLSQEESKFFLTDMYNSSPFPVDFTMRIVLWVMGCSPIFFLRRWTTLDRLSISDQLRVIQKMDASDSYWVRQFCMLMKLNGGLSHVSTTRFQTAMRETTRRSRSEKLGLDRISSTPPQPVRPEMEL